MTVDHRSGCGGVTIRPASPRPDQSEFPPDSVWVRPCPGTGCNAGPSQKPQHDAPKRVSRNPLQHSRWSPVGALTSRFQRCGRAYYRRLVERQSASRVHPIRTEVHGASRPAQSGRPCEGAEAPAGAWPPSVRDETPRACSISARCPHYPLSKPVSDLFPPKQLLPDATLD